MTTKSGRAWSVATKASRVAWGAVPLAGLLAGAAVSSCAETPKVVEAPPLREVRQARWFSGSDGMHVETLDFADDSSLVRVSGVDSEMTGKVLAYKRVQNGDRYEYRTKWHGRDWYALVRERGGQWMAYIPGSREGYSLQYAEDKAGSVDTAGIQRQHRAQEQSGELQALQRFDRAAEQKYAQDALAAESRRVSEQCGKPVPVSVRWSSVSDEQLLDKSVSGYCESILSGLHRLCGNEAGKRFVKAHVNKAECALDGDNSLSLQAQTLRWAINFDITNADDRAYTGLLALTPQGDKHTLEQQIQAEQTAVCADAERKHVVLIGPSEAAHKGLAYGDGKLFSWVATPRMLGDGWFFDPRQRNDKNNDNFRGLDLRLFSHIEPNLEAKSCKLTCGAREVALQLVTGDDKAAILDGASYQASPHQREPYALARDRSGNYYFVDRGNTQESARDFQLYRGPRGQMRKLPMKDVVSDSEGEIFASANGQLRLLLGKQSAQWIAGGTSTLQLLPVHENYALIYNELGVYMSAKLGVPCDDL